MSHKPDSVEQRLTRFAQQIAHHKRHSIGYPVNQNPGLTEFYSWYQQSGLTEIALNNAGDARTSSITPLNTHRFENEVIEYLAPLYGFNPKSSWGVITLSGTQGNNLGIYFGSRYLRKKSGLTPVLYVSAEAHYSIKQLADLQQLETRVIQTSVDGKMDVADLERQLDPTRPALMIMAIGTTFKGAIDDQTAINQILKAKKTIAVYRHLDAALFGGFLAFSPYADLINQARQLFDSIAVSGHKFFGIDEPAGIFITSHTSRVQVKSIQADYLNNEISTMTCSRSALATLKLWWKIQKTNPQDFRHQSQQILDTAQYLKNRLDSINYQAWLGPHSNTVYFQRPSQSIMEKWQLAPDSDPRLGGCLAHCVVMQHVTTDLIDEFVMDLMSDR